MSDILIRYRRVGPNYTGDIFVVDGEAHELEFQFQNQPFRVIMSCFAELLAEHKHAGGVVQRTDRDGLLPVRLDQNLLDLFRSDPVTAIKSLDIPHVQVPKIEIKPQGLAVGHDSFSDGFGYVLYCKRKENRIECPFCGKWHEADINLGIPKVLCEPKELVFSCYIKGSKWYVVRTDDVLNTSMERFFFPRGWNDFKPWISREELNNKYTEFLKEIENV